MIEWHQWRVQYNMQSSYSEWDRFRFDLENYLNCLNLKIAKIGAKLTLNRPKTSGPSFCFFSAPNWSEASERFWDGEGREGLLLILETEFGNNEDSLIIYNGPFSRSYKWACYEKLLPLGTSGLHQGHPDRRSSVITRPFHTQVKIPEETKNHHLVWWMIVWKW